MNADRTVEALKTILDGKTPEEIDAVVRDLKETLDQAAADIKGEMDIDSTAVVSDLKDEINQLSTIESAKNFSVPDCVIPSESDVKIKSCNRETDMASVEKRFKSVVTLDSSFVCAPEGLFGDKLEFTCTPIGTSSCNRGGDMFDKLKDSENGNGLSCNAKREFFYNHLTGSFYNKDGHKHDDLDDLEVTDLNAINNTVGDMYCTDRNATDPIQPFATRLFEKKLSKIESEIYSKYNVKNNLKNIKRKQKINNFLEKLHLSKFNLSVEKHKIELNGAITEIMLKVNHLDNESCIERMQFIGQKQAEAINESIETRKPVLYANPL